MHTAHFESFDIKIQHFILEITTHIGCVIDCTFCPQKTLLKAYESLNKTLTFGNFKKAIDKTPSGTIIVFSGFCEPFLNTECTNMILYACETGHPISIFTTGTGLSPSNLNKIKNINYSTFPHGGFVLHLADNEGYAKINVNTKYLQLLQAIKDANIPNIALRTMGSLHPAIRDIFSHDAVKTQTMNSRAGYLLKEGVKENYTSSAHTNDVICGRDEYIYNNVMLPNGDIALCCQDFGLRHILGNILTQSYWDILPHPLQTYQLCKTCHNALQLPHNFPKFVIEKHKKQQI